MARLLLLSTYELGEQPLGIAVPAISLGCGGHDLVAVDLSIDPWPTEALSGVDGVICSVPMHTALRLGIAALDRIRLERPSLPVALIGLYASVAERQGCLRPGDLASTGVDMTELLEWAGRLGSRLLRTSGGGGHLPRRDLLPPLERYARLEQDGVQVVVGAVESTVGCNHKCRHCPVPLVYHGRSKALDLDDVLADIGQLVDMGAGHIHFVDPDFLNRPQHAMRVARALARDHPGLSFDITAKVSHLLRHRELLAPLAEAGLSFVTSAFESTSNRVLERLDKGHTAADLPLAVEALRRVGVEPRPSLLPFTPWTSRDDLVELLDFVAAYDLVWNVDAVQYSIRLLLPPGSPLVEDADGETAAALTGYDADELGFTWNSADPQLDELQREVARVVEAANEAGLGNDAAYDAVRASVFAALDRPDAGAPTPRSLGRAEGPSRPRLSESWFCCAEPTAAQLGRLTTSFNAAPEFKGLSELTPISDFNTVSEPVAISHPTRRRPAR